MGDQVLYNKKKLCYTDVCDFTDFQGIGSNPLYKRFDSVLSVLRTCIDEKYISFVAQPVYHSEYDRIDWYVDNWNDTPTRYVQLPETEKKKYKQILDDTISHYRNAVSKLNTTDDLQIMGGILRHISDDKIFCFDGKVVMIAWGMKPDPYKTTEFGSVIHGIKSSSYCIVKFDAGEHGIISMGSDSQRVEKGKTLSPSQIPTVSEKEGFKFVYWSQNPLQEINSDTTFVATYEKIQPIFNEPQYEEPINQFHHVHFDAGEHGKLKGQSDLSILSGTALQSSMIPSVKPSRRYKFIGWNIDPLNTLINQDCVFQAEYEKKKPWYLRIPRWLWYLLLSLLLLLLLLFFLRSCKSCGRNALVCPVPNLGNEEWITTDPNVGHNGGIYDPGNPYVSVPTPPEFEHILPPNQGELPPISDRDEIVSNPGQPTIMANRLNILMENTEKSILDLAKSFKQKFPGDQYKSYTTTM